MRGVRIQIRLSGVQMYFNGGYNWELQRSLFRSQSWPVDHRRRRELARVATPVSMKKSNWRCAISSPFASKPWRRSLDRTDLFTWGTAVFVVSPPRLDGQSNVVQTGSRHSHRAGPAGTPCGSSGVPPPRPSPHAPLSPSKTAAEHCRDDEIFPLDTRPQIRGTRARSRRTS
jgi:hypothetical protein